MRGFLLQRGIKVPENRVREIMRVVDPSGVYQRTSANRAIVRRVYFVQYSNDLWHIDTNMKLVRYCNIMLYSKKSRVIRMRC